VTVPVSAAVRTCWATRGRNNNVCGMCAVGVVEVGVRKDEAIIIGSVPATDS
jgi:hypothetical protein